MTENLINKRKIYNRDYLLSHFYYPKSIPEYLLPFPELFKTEEDNLWCKKPLPKFEEIVEGSRYKTNYVNSNYQGRQRINSNHSGENGNDSEINLKNKSAKTHSIMKLKTDKYNRNNIVIDSIPDSSSKKEYIDERNDDSWKTVESKPYKSSNTFSKPFISNYQGQENHWKKWGKDRTLNDNKNASSFNRNEKTNNFTVQKAEPEVKFQSKDQTSQNFSVATDQTEDIWQDDWDTEMQSKIAITPVESLESYELPPSSIAVSHIFETEKDGITNVTSDTDFNMWFYKDLSENIQGPFPSESMANWLATGYFNYATSLRRKCDEKFLLLAEYRALYGRIPFTTGHIVPPILQNTAIEIDLKQLLVGVDRNIMQKVLTNATSLSKQNMPFRNNNVSPVNIASSINIDKQAIIEEKRQIEECKAELERERKRIHNEQEEWKIRMEDELKSRVQSLFDLQSKEISKTLSELTLNSIKLEVSPIIKEDNIQPKAEECNELQGKCSEEKIEEHFQVKTDEQIDLRTDTKNEKINTISKDQNESKDTSIIITPNKKSEMTLHLEDLKGDDWLSKKDIKNKKKSKAKNKMIKQSHAYSPEIKKTDSDVSNVFKNYGSVQIIIKESDNEIRKPIKISDGLTNQIIWNLNPEVLNVEKPKHSKSLLEIQAEEAQNEKVIKELENVINHTKMEANKITSFKESLLKNVKTTNVPIIPPGKSIWDVAEINTDVPIIETISKPERNVINKSDKISSDTNNNDHDDGLLIWCKTKLSKFKKDFDVQTVVDLLKQVPSEDVMDLTVELLDDSDFSRNFAKDFIKRRQDFNLSISKNEDVWQTVKKSQIVTPVLNNTNINNKKSKKKKMVVIDHTKFRSS